MEEPHMTIRNDVQIIKSYSQASERAHQAVLHNSYWFSDKPRLLDNSFSAENTKTRSAVIIDILRRAAKRKTLFAEKCSELADKLSGCSKNHRCGSSACLNCLRAFQQAKTAAHRELIAKVAGIYLDKLVYLLTIIPNDHYGGGELHEFNAEAFKRLLAEPLANYRIPFVGSIDFELKRTASRKYVQPHFHIAIHTSEYDLARASLKYYFEGQSKWEYPVDLTEMIDLDVVPYMHKAIKINHLLRTGRRYLPELLLMLDANRPLDLMVMQHVVLSVQAGGFKFEIEVKGT
jgi:hypothetical protein